LAGVALLGFLFVGVLIIGSIIRGWALSYLWEWFIVPFGLPTLGIAHAIGISMVVAFLTHELNSNSDEGAEIGRAIGIAMIYPFIALLFGYIVHSFM
jgi:MFS family permease